jgi:hypothetical protein
MEFDENLTNWLFSAFLAGSRIQQMADREINPDLELVEMQRQFLVICEKIKNREMTVCESFSDTLHELKQNQSVDELTCAQLTEADQDQRAIERRCSSIMIEMMGQVS